MEGEMTYILKTFGRDCMGNITGYMVCSSSVDILGHPEVVAGTFEGNIYEDGSFDDAKQRATACLNFMNTTVCSGCETEGHTHKIGTVCQHCGH